MARSTASRRPRAANSSRKIGFGGLEACCGPLCGDLSVYAGFDSYANQRNVVLQMELKDAEAINGL
jgi:hypothetical protein